MSTVMLFVSDCPLEEVPYPPDFAIHFDIDHGTVDGGGRDDGFAIIPAKRVLELSTEKRYFAVLEWEYTPGRAAQIIVYLQEQLKAVEEIEFWHIWQDMDFGHKVWKVEIPIMELSVGDIQELYQLEVWEKPVTDYCYVITRAN